MARKNHSQKLRFIMVGGGSTIIDFGVLFLLHALGLQSIISNFISTGIAFCFSFISNRKYTFKAHSGNVKRQFVLFFIVTFFGLWVIQPVIIGFVEPSLRPLGYEDWVSLFIAKILATVVTLIWNYFFYSRFVFSEAQRE